MDIFKKIVLSACILSIVVSIADSVVPSEKFARQLRMIFSMVFVSGIIASAVKSDLSFEIPAFAGAVNTGQYENISAAANEAMENAAEKSINDMIKRILTSEGISCEKIAADINMNEDGSINIIEIGYKGRDIERASEIIKENIGETEVKRIE